MTARPADPLTALFRRSVAPIDVADLGRGAALLVPNGAGFGTSQIWRGETPWDWVRHRPDGYWVKGDRGSAHAGFDLGFFVRGGQVYPLPAGLPVRSPVDAVAEKAGADADPEPGPGGVVLALGPARAPRLYVHLTDFHVTVRRGRRVARGDVIGETAVYSRRFPIVVLHAGIGVLQRGEPPNPLDPTPLLRRWDVRHPVFVDSTCDASALNRGKPGRWRAPGEIDHLEPVATWNRRWRDIY